MSSVQPITVAPMSTGQSLVDATALDATFQQIASKINVLIMAMSVMRENDDLLADGSVRWRMFSELARTMISDCVVSMQLLRDNLRTQITYPLGGKVEAPQFVPRYTIFPPADQDAFGFRGGVYGTPTTITRPIVAPGVPELTYMMTLRLRCMMEGTWVNETGFSYTGVYCESGPYAPPADVLVDGRTFFSATRSIKSVNTYDYLKLLVTRQGGGVETYILNGQFGNPANGDTAMPVPGSDPVRYVGADPCYPIDTTLEIILRPGDRVEFSYNATDGESAVATRTDYPPDDDPRFPYTAIYRDPLALQLDILSFVPLSANQYDSLITTSLGYPILTSGPGGPLEVSP